MFPIKKATEFVEGEMIILLNGCLNAGKTTVANEIKNKGIGVAHIEVDSLRDFIQWMPLEETIELNLKNAIAVARNFHEQNIHSIISYPLSESDLLFIRDLLTDVAVDVYAVALYPGIDKLKTNRGTRELTELELNRIDELHEMGVTKPNFGVVIDNSSQTVSETADAVLRAVGFNSADHSHFPGMAKCAW